MSKTCHWKVVQNTVKLSTCWKNCSFTSFITYTLKQLQCIDFYTKNL